MSQPHQYAPSYYAQPLQAEYGHGPLANDAQYARPSYSTASAIGPSQSFNDAHAANVTAEQYNHMRALRDQQLASDIGRPQYSSSYYANEAAQAAYDQQPMQMPQPKVVRRIVTTTTTASPNSGLPAQLTAQQFYHYQRQGDRSRPTEPEWQLSPEGRPIYVHREYQTVSLPDGKLQYICREYQDHITNDPRPSPAELAQLPNYLPGYEPYQTQQQIVRRGYTQTDLAAPQYYEQQAQLDHQQQLLLQQQQLLQFQQQELQHAQHAQQYNHQPVGSQYVQQDFNPPAYMQAQRQGSLRTALQPSNFRQGSTRTALQAQSGYREGDSTRTALSYYNPAGTSMEDSTRTALPSNYNYEELPRSKQGSTRTALQYYDANQDSTRTALSYYDPNQGSTRTALSAQPTQYETNQYEKQSSKRGTLGPHPGYYADASPRSSSGPVTAIVGNSAVTLNYDDFAGAQGHPPSTRTALLPPDQTNSARRSLYVQDDFNPPQLQYASKDLQEQHEQMKMARHLRSTDGKSPRSPNRSRRSKYGVEAADR